MERGEWAGGRPWPRGPFGVAGNNGSINSHCSSVSFIPHIKPSIPNLSRQILKLTHFDYGMTSIAFYAWVYPLTAKQVCLEIFSRAPLQAMPHQISSSSTAESSESAPTSCCSERARLSSSSSWMSPLTTPTMLSLASVTAQETVITSLPVKCDW